MCVYGCVYVSGGKENIDLKIRISIGTVDS